MPKLIPSQGVTSVAKSHSTRCHPLKVSLSLDMATLGIKVQYVNLSRTDLN